MFATRSWPLQIFLINSLLGKEGGHGVLVKDLGTHQGHKLCAMDCQCKKYK